MDYMNEIQLAKQIEDTNTRIKEIVKIKNQIEFIDINNYNTYFMVIDIFMLLSIEYYLIKNDRNAKKYLKKTINFGEKYNYYSKKNYYDILNCAYTWLAYYSFVDKNYNTCEKYCHKVLNNYLEVKNDPNYHVIEKESVDICKNYLIEIKNIRKL